MEGTRGKKLHTSRGFSRLTALLLLLVLALLAGVLLPTVRHYRFQADSVACASALDTARRQLAADYMLRGSNSTAKEAREYVGLVMDGWDDLCPAGGTCYIVHRTDSELEWDVVCGLHGADRKQCTRLNADYLLNQLREELRRQQLAGNPCPSTLTASVNGKRLTARLTEEETGLRRGTSATVGEKGTVLAYGIAGHGAFDSDSGAKPGEICYFSYANEEYCANWSAREGWTGDSWS